MVSVLMRQLAVLALIQLWVPTVAIERTAVADSDVHAPHHKAHHPARTDEVAAAEAALNAHHAPHAHEAPQHQTLEVDKKGAAHNPHMRREPLDATADQDAFQSVKHTHHHKRSHHHVASQRPEMLLADGPVESVASDTDDGEEQIQDVSHADTSGEHPNKFHDVAGAEKELEAVDDLIEHAEEKAGLPNSLLTTIEPQDLEPTEEEQEYNALLIAGISIIVLIGAASAGWSMWLARQMYTNKANAGLMEDNAGEYDENAGEYEQEGEEAAGEAQ